MEPVQDRQEWESELRRELEEAREDHERGADQEHKDYLERLQAWKETHGEPGG